MNLMTDVARQLVFEAQDAMLAGDYRRAIYLCEQAIERDPKLLTAHQTLKDAREGYVNDEILKAYDASDAGNDAAARRICTELLKFAPNDPDIYYTRSFFHDSKEGSQSDLEIVVSYNPTDPEGYRRHAVALDMLGRFAEAERTWSRLLRLERENPDNWMGRAETRLGAADYAGAMSDIDEALRLNPAHEGARRNQAYARLLNGEFEQAIELAQAAFDSTADDWFVSVRAEALVHLHRYDQAVAAYEVLRESDESAVDWARYATALTRLGHHEDALGALDKSLEADRDDGWHTTRAETLLALGRHAEAITHLDASLEYMRALRDEDDPAVPYNLAYCLAHRAAMAERYGLTRIDIERERDEAVQVMSERFKVDKSALRYAKSAREFDSFWSRPELAEFAQV